jgi:uncharacterized protein
MHLAAFTARDVAGPLEPTGPRAGADVGAPMTSCRVLQAGGDGLPEVGVWECTPGGWAIEDRPDTETVVVVSGAATLTTRGGAPMRIGPGDTVVLPRGWSGRWDVPETLRKVYVLS